MLQLISLLSQCVGGIGGGGIARAALRQAKSAVVSTFFSE
jgi:hypothetical protein